MGVFFQPSPHLSIKQASKLSDSQMPHQSFHFCLISRHTAVKTKCCSYTLPDKPNDFTHEACLAHHWTGVNALAESFKWWKDMPPSAECVQNPLSFISENQASPGFQESSHAKSTQQCYRTTEVWNMITKSSFVYFAFVTETPQVLYVTSS